MKKKSGGRTEFKKAKSLTEEIAGLAEIPGALEMLVSVAAEKLGGPGKGKTKQLRLFNMGGAVHKAEGGLAQAAEMTRAGGRGDDEMLLHLAPEEYEAITSMWGEPEINPSTGIPEYGFLSKLWKGVKKVVKKIVKSPIFSMVAPIALNVFAPGLGSAVGGWLGATGKAAATIGNTLIRGGIGAVSGGKTGAISGVLSGLTAGGVGSKIGSKFGFGDRAGKIAGDALLGGVAGEATGAGFAQGATGQAMQSLMGNPMQKIESRLTEGARKFFNPATGEISEGSMTLDPSVQDPFGYGSEDFPQTTTSGAVLSDDAIAQADPSLWGRSVDWMREHPWLTAGGALAAGSMLGGGGGGSGGDAPPQLPDSFTSPLPNLSFDRTAMPIEDYYSYGQSGGEANFFSNNAIPSTTPDPTNVGSGGGVPGGGAPGDQPYRPQGGMSGMMGRALRQQQGWTWDENTGMLYPPGHFGVGGTGPVMGSHGGYVHEYRLGGLVRKYQVGGHVRGVGTGRSDDIEAVLSDGEYIIDSESVALLGDGSTDAGAERLDEMRNKLRKHKGKKLSKGGFSDAAKTPEEYMAEGGKVGKSALRSLKKLAHRFELAVSSGNKKRVGEITSQLKSLNGGAKILEGFAKGGSVKRIIDSLERRVETDYRGGGEGKVEKRLKDRRLKERKEDVRKKRRLSDRERADLAEELGGFPKNSRFIRNLKKQLKEKPKETS